jgi:hypothetical protein
VAARSLSDHFCGASVHAADWGRGPESRPQGRLRDGGVTVSKLSAGVGTAAFVLGLSLLGPQAYGVAAADTGEERSTSTNSVASGSQRGSAGPARPARASRNGGSQAATRGPVSAAAATPRESVRAAAAVDAVPVSKDAGESVVHGTMRRNSAPGRSRPAPVAGLAAGKDVPGALVAPVEATDPIVTRRVPVTPAVAPAAARHQDDDTPHQQPTDEEEHHRGRDVPPGRGDPAGEGDGGARRGRVGAGHTATVRP